MRAKIVWLLNKEAKSPSPQQQHSSHKPTYRPNWLPNSSPYNHHLHKYDHRYNTYKALQVTQMYLLTTQTKVYLRRLSMIECKNFCLKNVGCKHRLTWLTSNSQLYSALKIHFLPNQDPSNPHHKSLSSLQDRNSFNKTPLMIPQSDSKHRC